MKKMKKSFMHATGMLATALALLLQSPAMAADPLPRIDPAKAGFSAGALERIDRFFADEISRDRIPGAVVAVARDANSSTTRRSAFRTRPPTCR